MVLKAGERQKREFTGVSFELLPAVKGSMVTKKEYEAGDFIPEHTHQDVQWGYVLSGIYLLSLEYLDEILIKGDIYSVPANAEHSMQILEAGEMIEIFSPPGQDLL
jgi:quercetin dioxygenase-like cupin family protein